MRPTLLLLLTVAACNETAALKLGDHRRLAFSYESDFGRTVSAPLATASTITIDLGELPFSISAESSDVSVLTIVPDAEKVRVAAKQSGSAELRILRADTATLVDSAMLTVSDIASLEAEEESLGILGSIVTSLFALGGQSFHVTARNAQGRELVIGDDSLAIGATDEKKIAVFQSGNSVVVSFRERGRFPISVRPKKGSGSVSVTAEQE